MGQVITATEVSWSLEIVKLCLRQHRCPDPHGMLPSKPHMATQLNVVSDHGCQSGGKHAPFWNVTCSVQRGSARSLTFHHLTDNEGWRADSANLCSTSSSGRPDLLGPLQADEFGGRPGSGRTLPHWLRHVCQRSEVRMYSGSPDGHCSGAFRTC